MRNVLFQGKLFQGKCMNGNPKQKQYKSQKSNSGKQNFQHKVMIQPSQEQSFFHACVFSLVVRIPFHNLVGNPFGQCQSQFSGNRDISRRDQIPCPVGIFAECNVQDPVTTVL